MLPTALVRVRDDGQRLRPSYVRTQSRPSLEVAAELIACFTEHLGRTQGELKEALRVLEGSRPSFRLARGLVHLLLARMEAEMVCPVDPVQVRERVFSEAAARRVAAVRVGEGWREEALAAVAAEMAATPEAIEAWLYADLRDAQEVRHFEAITPEALLQRYNVALAQSVLARAKSLHIVVQGGAIAPGELRALFRGMKFHGLLHQVERRPGAAPDSVAYAITVDGPLALLSQGQKYSKSMASFLPTLLRCPGWTAVAELAWGPSKSRRTFEIEAGELPWPGAGRFDPGESEIHRLFVDRFAAAQDEWELTQEDLWLPLGAQGLWIPDYKIRHRSSGREAYLEILGYWRADYLQRRLELLARSGPPNLVLAVSEAMRVDKHKLAALSVPVIFFKRVLRAKEVLATLEEVARVPLVAPG